VDVIADEQQQYELLYANPQSNQDYISLRKWRFLQNKTNLTNKKEQSQSTYSYTTTSTGGLCDRHSKLYADSCQSQMTALK
jgi:hypothetical protein